MTVNFRCECLCVVAGVGVAVAVAVAVAVECDDETAVTGNETDQCGEVVEEMLCRAASVG